MKSKPSDSPIHWTVAEFLVRFRAVLDIGAPDSIVWHEIGRRMEEIAAIGLTRNQVLDEIKCIEVSHHHRGPEADDKYPEGSALHIFKYPMKGERAEIYVKLSLRLHSKKRHVVIAKIWSFKRSEQD